MSHDEVMTHRVKSEPQALTMTGDPFAQARRKDIDFLKYPFIFRIPESTPSSKRHNCHSEPMNNPMGG
jgi:hypothetical protein